MTDQAKAEADLEWVALCERVALHCAGPVAAASVIDTRPALTPDEARRRATLSREAIALLTTGEPLPVGAVEELGEVLDRLDRGSDLSGAELRGLGETCRLAEGLARFLGGRSDVPALTATLAVDPGLGPLGDRLTRAIDDDGELTDAASPELRRLRRRVRDTKGELRALMTRLVARHAEALREQFHTDYDGRYVLPVRADAPFRVEGIVLGSSASGATLYVEPREATELGNRHRVAIAEVERETARVLAELSRATRSLAPAVRAGFEAAVQADVVGAIARFAVATRSSVLEPRAEPSIILRQMRHPLLDGGSGEVIPNDIAIAAPGALIISGPNAGGKTVALKCLGLAAWMARAGFPLPLEPQGSHVGWFDTVLTDIGDEQSIAQSLSTFSAHSARVAHYVASAGPSTLVLLDEVAGGTDPDEGSALAVAVVEALVERGAAVAVTTHYDRLKHLAAGDSRFENASVGFDVERMLPTFRLTLGRPGASSALAVAARFGMDEAVVARARRLLPAAWENREALIHSLENRLAEAEQARLEAEGDRREQARLRAELTAEREQARQKERALLARETEGVRAEVREARSQLLAAKRRLQSDGGASLAEAAKEINDAASRVAIGSAVDRAVRDTEGSAAPPTLGTITEGALVRVSSLGVKGRVVSPPDGRGRVTVRSGTMKLTAKASDLVLLEAPRAPPPRKAAVPPRGPRVSDAPAPGSSIRTRDNTCDLRGVRVEDVDARLETFVDDLLRRGEAVGYVLHGHGTGALRGAVRERLPAVPFVEEVRAASKDEGGEAFTVVVLAG